MFGPNPAYVKDYTSDALFDCPLLPHIHFRYLALRTHTQKILNSFGPSDQNSTSVRPKRDLFILCETAIRQTEVLKQGSWVYLVTFTTKNHSYFPSRLQTLLG